MSDGTETESQTMRHRPDDPPVKITRVLPLEWVLGVLGAFCLFGVTQYVQVQRQGETLTRVESQLQKMVDAQENKGAKDQDRDLDIRELKGRVATLERDRVPVKR